MKTDRHPITYATKALADLEQIIGETSPVARGRMMLILTTHFSEAMVVANRSALPYKELDANDPQFFQGRVGG